jgi:hypothetical protein
MNMSTTNNIFNNTTQSALNLVDLNNDVLTLICKHLNMKEACNLYRTGSKNLRSAIAKTKFDFFDVPIPYGVSVRQFRKVFSCAIGLNIYNPYEMTNDDLKCMIPRNCYGKKMKGFRLNLSTYKDLPYRGTTNPYYRRFSRKAFKRLKGIHTLSIYSNFQIDNKDFRSLRGINTLNMDFCDQIRPRTYRYIRGIKHLSMRCLSDKITDEVLTHLDGVQTLDVKYSMGISYEGYEELMGVPMAEEFDSDEE